MRLRAGLLIAALALAGRASAEAEKVAIFDLSFINFGQEVEFGAKNEAEHARIAMLSDYFRELLVETGRYEPVDLSPVEAELELNQQDVFRCNNCEAPMARKLGVEHSFTGAVQKLSVLVQTIIIRETDATTGEVIALYQTDIRNNTDEAWRRGLKWLVENRLMVPAP
jgi:hypothetical protein